MYQICDISNSIPFIALFFLVVLLLLIAKSVSFSSQYYWGLLLLLCILIFSIIRSIDQKRIFPALRKQRYFVVLDEYPQEKAKTFQVVCQLIDSDLKILTYLPKSPAVKSAQPGDILCLTGFPELIENDGNPFEFDYRKYLNNKGIGYRIFLKESQFFFLVGQHQMNINRHALILREKLIDILYKSGMKRENVPLVSSISFGAREDVDKETVRSFTNTGVIHVLAVSGMNVGLIFVILDFLLRFLKRGRIGFLCHTLIILFSIWSYALITGMSASILRAAVMLTFVVVGNALQQKANIFNSLAVSAFFLVAWDPVIIYDVGFQLSYVAVLSIVVIQPILYKQLYFKSWIVDQTWLILSVTCSAQVGTLPFTLHYFHQFPVYFWLANLIVIPLVTLILYLSFLVLFLTFISGFLTSLSALVLDWSVRLVLLTVNLVEKLPMAVLKGLYPSSVQLMLVFSIFLFFYMFFKTRKILHVKVICTLAIVLFITTVISSYSMSTKAEIVFFNVPGTRAMALTRGRKTIVVYDKCENGESKLNYYLKPYLGSNEIIETEYYKFSDSLRIMNASFSIRGNYILFNGVKLFVKPDSSGVFNNEEVGPKADVVWLSDIKPLPLKDNIFPEARIILYRSSKEVENEINASYPHMSFNIRKAVLMTFDSEGREGNEGFKCGYFIKNTAQ
ncbi:MAG: ComEC/Rec2 family competence protein [Prolixibacteraceae bacterium]